jgi:hypothetical protein
MWAIHAAPTVRKFAHMVHKNPIRESPSKIILDKCQTIPYIGYINNQPEQTT